MPNGRDHSKRLESLARWQAAFHEKVDELEARLKFYRLHMWPVFKRIYREYRKARPSLPADRREEGERLLNDARAAHAEYRIFRAFVSAMKKDIETWEEELEKTDSIIAKIHIHQLKIARLAWLGIYLQKQIEMLKVLSTVFVNLRNVARGK